MNVRTRKVLEYYCRLGCVRRRDPKCPVAILKPIVCERQDQVFAKTTSWLAANLGLVPNSAASHDLSSCKDKKFFSLPNNSSCEIHHNHLSALLLHS